jgi:hypothetical protein
MNMIMNHDDILGKLNPVCDDELSIASCSSFDELVDEVLDEAASAPPSITTFPRREMVTAAFPRQVSYVIPKVKNNELPYASLKRLDEQKLLPRQVSLSLEGMLRGTHVPKNNELPYAGLKRLAERKQNTAPFKKQKTEGKNITRILVDDEDNAVSAANHHQRPEQKQKKPKPKRDVRRWKSRPRPGRQEGDVKGSVSLLCVACCLSSVTVGEVQDLIMMDPEAIRRPIAVPGESYKYPLNMAIRNNANADVIRLLLEADPTVTSLPDGAEGQGSLQILLRQQRHRRDILPLVDSFLLAHPSCAQIQDSHGCVPLHTAVYHQAELDTVRHLNMVYPEALQIQDRRQQTPVALATQLHAVCSDAVATFLSESLLDMENEAYEMGDAPGII